MRVGPDLTQTEGEPLQTTTTTFFKKENLQATLRREISRMAVEGTPSDSGSRRIFFRATYWSVSLSLAWSPCKKRVIFKYTKGKQDNDTYKAKHTEYFSRLK